MEEKLFTQPGNEAIPVKEKVHRTEVITVRDWKEYLGEAFLIVFSVPLALLLTEVFNNLHEKEHNREVLSTVREELINNKKAEEEQYQYHLQVLKNIDSALANPVISKKFIRNGVLDLTIIAPHGVLRHDLDDVAWQIAKQNNIFSKIDLGTYSLLTSVYDNQQKIGKIEDEIAKVLLAREARTATDNRITLILMKDSYHGWAVDRAPELMEKYKKAIDALSSYLK